MLALHQAHWQSEHRTAHLRLLVAVFTLVLSLPIATAFGACPDDNPTDISPCGPTFVLPQWADGSGWDQVKYTATIQLGNIDGLPGDELVARSAQGIQIEQFTPNGQWQTLRNTDGTIALADFSDANGWDQPQYYLTIQLVDLDGDGQAELIGRSANGLVVYTFACSSNDCPSGTWTKLKETGPFPDSQGWNQPQYYRTIHFADIDGQQGNEMIARGPDGLHTYKWNIATHQFQAVGPVLTAWSDANGWNQPESYLTIQLADVDRDGRAEVLSLSSLPSDGVQTYHWDTHTNAWELLNGQGPFPNSPTDQTGTSWATPPYYSTVRLADIDGDGQAELLGRSRLGVLAYHWNTGTKQWDLLGALQGPFADTDGSGMQNPQSYLTVQYADVDGNGTAELLGRANDGMQTWFWNTAARAWGNQQGQPALSESLNPAWADVSHYGTIHVGQVLDANDNPLVLLIARGNYGIRTWAFNPNSTWERPVPYGSFPQFTGDQAKAYTRLNQFLKLVDVRDTYTDPTTDPTSNTLNGYQTSITPRCSDEISANPPQYASCSPPDTSVSPAAWTVVSNQIIAELYWAQQTIDYFTTLDTLHGKLFFNEDSQFPAITTDLHLREEAKNATLNLTYFNLFTGLVAVLGGPISPIASALVVLVNAVPGLSSPSTSTFEQTYGQVATQMAKYQESIQDRIHFQNTYVRGDYGLLTTVGTLVGEKLWTVDEEGFLSAGRLQFTRWVYQAFLATNWANFQVTNCRNRSGLNWLITCSAPADGPYIETNDGVNFSALLSIDGSGCTEHCSGGDCVSGCAWSAPDSDELNFVTGAISDDCTYNPATGHAWEYGCNLGVSFTELFNNSNGWNFKTYKCNENDGSSCPLSGTALAGQARRVGTGRGQITMTGDTPLAGNLVDLSRSTVTVELLLHEAGGGGAGELALHPAGQTLFPLVLTPGRGKRANFATFKTRQRRHPGFELTLRVRDGVLHGRLQAEGLSIQAPQGCTADDLTTDLHTVIVIDDGMHKPILFGTVDSWECVTNRQDGVQSLRLRPEQLDETFTDEAGFEVDN